jgi:hypothetical protein
MEQDPDKSPGAVDGQLSAMGIALQPCPTWCVGDHFGMQPRLFAEDCFFHDGPSMSNTDSSSTLGDGGPFVELEFGLSSWVPTLAAEPGPTRVRLSGSSERLYFSPERARELAVELNRLADQAETGPASPRGARRWLGRLPMQRRQRANG